MQLPCFQSCTMACTKGLENACLVSPPPPLLRSCSLPEQVYGPESSMTGICAQAINYVKGFDSAVGVSA